MTPDLRRSGTYLVCLLCGLSFWLIIGAVVVEGKINPPAQSNSLVKNNSVSDHARHNHANRRDPFKRIEKRMPAPTVSKKPHPVLPIVLGVEDPAWKLLGVLHGNAGHQAVIQLSPTNKKDRIVVQRGSKLAQSGWTVKTISEEGVLLEHLSSPSSIDLPSRTRSLLLSFPSIPKSP